MKYYIEITLLPDAEVGLGFLWQKVYQQLHLALAQIKNENGLENIGVSFPQYGDKTFPLGKSLRLFARLADDLESLKIDQWFERLLDYVNISSLFAVPKDVHEYAVFSRKQPKMDFMRRVEKQATRHGVTIEEALEHFKNYEKENTLTLPFVNAYSQTWKKNFPLFIEKTAYASETLGKFDTYGLSKEATVPWF